MTSIGLFTRSALPSRIFSDTDRAIEWMMRSYPHVPGVDSMRMETARSERGTPGLRYELTETVACSLGLDNEAVANIRTARAASRYFKNNFRHYFILLRFIAATASLTDILPTIDPSGLAV